MQEARTLHMLLGVGARLLQRARVLVHLAQDALVVLRQLVRARLVLARLRRQALRLLLGAHHLPARASRSASALLQAARPGTGAYSQQV